MQTPWVGYAEPWLCNRYLNYWVCWFNHRADMIWSWAQHQVKHVQASHSIASKSILSNEPVTMLQNLLFCNVQQYTGNLNCS